MTLHDVVPVRELSAWGFDDYPYRPVVDELSAVVCTPRPPYQQMPALVEDVPAIWNATLALQADRQDLKLEMAGLDWSLGFVDLRHLLSFQRRLSFDPQAPSLLIPAPDDWPARLAFAFAAPRPATHRVLVRHATSLILRSPDPNLTLHLDHTSTPALTLKGGSPFLEVATYRDRWFLRDGYHRAFHLLRRDLRITPAVVVHARSIEELGATLPRFFSEATLFSADPPRVIDFLDDTRTLHSMRPRLQKQIRVTVEEMLVPDLAGDQP